MTSFPAGHVLTAAELNSAIDAPFITGSGAWQSYTPVWTASTTNPVLGNGSLTGAYLKINRGVWFWWLLTMGSTTTYGTGNYFISLPVTSIAGGGNIWLGRANMVDSSAVVRNIKDMWIWSTSTLIMSNELGVLTTNTSPWTWAVNDSIAGQGFYPAAA